MTERDVTDATDDERLTADWPPGSAAEYFNGGIGVPARLVLLGIFARVVGGDALAGAMAAGWTGALAGELVMQRQHGRDWPQVAASMVGTVVWSVVSVAAGVGIEVVGVSAMMIPLLIASLLLAPAAIAATQRWSADAAKEESDEDISRIADLPGWPPER